MKLYDIYLVMSPEGATEEYMGALAEQLLKSGLKYTRHVGQTDNLAARRDISRLLDECHSVLFIANKASNSSELTAEALQHANRQGMEIVVVRADDSPYPVEIAAILADAPTYDATDPATRSDAMGDAIRRLGGRNNIVAKPGGAPSSGGSAGSVSADPVVSDTSYGGQPAVDDTDDEHIVRNGPSLSVIVVEIVLGILVVAGIIALVF